MAEEEIPRKDLQLDLETIRVFLNQIEQWQKQEISTIRDASGVLPSDWEVQMRSKLLERAEEENPRVTPLIKARFSADPKEVPLDATRSLVGQPMVGENIIVTGHISGSTLWLYDKDRDRLQTMVRLLIRDESGFSLIDVYSDPVHPALIPAEYGDNLKSMNVNATEPTRARRVLKQAKDLEIEGWVRIPEIFSKQEPSYPAASEK